MPNIDSVASINYSLSKYHTKNHIPADVQLSDLLHTQM